MASAKPKVTLYDYLYVDNERVHSLAAQLLSGLNTGIETSAGITETKTQKGTGGFRPVGTYELGYTTSTDSANKRHVIPHDLIHSDLIVALREAGYLVEQLAETPMGSLLLLSGTMHILEFESAGQILSLAQRFMAYSRKIQPEPAVPAGTGVGKNKAGKKTPAPSTPDEMAMEFTMDIVPDIAKLMGKATQLVFTPETGKQLWGGLHAQNFREIPGISALKHGAKIEGEWYLLAVLDTSLDVHEVDVSGMNEFLSGMFQASHGMRPMIGRPEGVYGVTPLLIFRKLVPAREPSPAATT